jgi:hypothetical protein
MSWDRAFQCQNAASAAIFSYAVVSFVTTVGWGSRVSEKTDLRRLGSRKAVENENCETLVTVFDMLSGHGGERASGASATSDGAFI